MDRNNSFVGCSLSISIAQKLAREWMEELMVPAHPKETKMHGNMD